MAEERLPHLLQTLKRPFEVKATVRGELLRDRFYRSVMFNELALPFLDAAHVSADVGTGLVHSSFAHGFDDYKVSFGSSRRLCSWAWAPAS